MDGEVDVVWGATSTGPASVATVPLLELERIGVVSADHDLAEAESVPADELADRPLLYLPCAPPELISSFVLADVRPARLGRLVETDATDSQSIVQGLGPGQAAVFADGSWASSGPMSGIHLGLTGLDPIPLYAAHRRSDRRGPVRTLVALLPQVAAS